MRIAAGFADAVGNLLAGVGLAAGDHDLGAELRQQFGRSAADAAARAGDNRDLTGEIEGCVFHWLFPPSAVIAKRRSNSDFHHRTITGLLRCARNDEYCSCFAVIPGWSEGPNPE